MLPCVVVLLMAGIVRGASFYNLDFESANNLPAPYSFVSISNALPGWLAYAGTNQLSEVKYQVNPTTTGYPVTLVGSNKDVLSGNFSVIFTGTIAQTGDIPTGTESITFQAVIFPSESLTLSFDGQNVPYFAIGAGTNSLGNSYTIYGANISALAGQTETMDFLGSAVLDDIQFSAQPVPEPSGLALLALSGGVLICVRRCAGKC